MVTLTLGLILGMQASQPATDGALDFWVGSWKCSGESYGPNGKTTHTEGTNKITRTFGGHVIQENFKGQGFDGMSVSVFEPNSKTWRQTWVDNQGGYIPLRGGKVDDKVILQTLSQAKQPDASSRMVFYNIQKDSFDWDWESTTDGGKTWNLAWRVHYTRAKK